ncbi:ABC transporter substrate-binding protein [Nocardioides caldifontis]|uniref:ABC transporter substrate-binding protein n=1 Tax=Nocardioides caldifontis TaxID=2588938 RepID=UPI0011DFDEA8|nr:ABC transporter substrate-binding protein [Nocardioides caldifontis]
MRKINIGRRAAVLGTGLLLSLGSLTACGDDEADGSGDGGSGGSKAASEVSVLLEWFPNPDHISLYTAKEMGAFEEEGLEVKFQPPSNNTDSLKMVSLGQMPLAISYANAIINAEAEGLDVVAVAALIPTTLNSLILHRTDEVQDITDLKGKPIGSSGDPVSEAMWAYALKQQGFEDEDIKFVSINQGYSPAMISGKVNAIIGAYQNIESVELREHGVDPVGYAVGEAGVPEYDELVLIAQRSKLESDEGYQETVRKFLAGLAKGDAKAQEDHDAAFDAIEKVAKGYSPESMKEMIDQTAPLLENPDGFGQMDVAEWQELADWLYDNDLLSKEVDAEKVVTTDYLPKAAG